MNNSSGPNTDNMKEEAGAINVTPTTPAAASSLEQSPQTSTAAVVEQTVRQAPVPPVAEGGAVEGTEPSGSTGKKKISPSGRPIKGRNLVNNFFYKCDQPKVIVLNQLDCVAGEGGAGAAATVASVGIENAQKQQDEQQEPMPPPSASSLALVPHPNGNNNSSGGSSVAAANVVNSCAGSSGQAGGSPGPIVIHGARAGLMMADPLGVFQKSNGTLQGSCNTMLGIINSAFAELETLDVEKHGKMFRIFRSLGSEVKGVQHQVQTLTHSSTIQSHLARAELLASYQNTERANEQLRDAHETINKLHVQLNKMDTDIAAIRVQFQWKDYELTSKVEEYEKELKSKEDAVAEMKRQQEQMALQIDQLKIQLIETEQGFLENQAKAEHKQSLIEAMIEEHMRMRTAPTALNQLIWARHGKRNPAEVSILPDEDKDDMQIMKRGRVDVAGDDGEENQESGNGMELDGSEGFEEAGIIVAETNDEDDGSIVSTGGPSGLTMVTRSATSGAKFMQE